MDRGWEWERKLEGLRKQKNKLLEEKSRLLDELRLQITAVDKTEGNLENVRRQINHCDSQMRDPLAEAFDELVPPGNSEQRTMALKGWIEIRKILKNKDVWSQTAYQVCKEIYESIIEPNESKGCPSELACNPLMSSGDTPDKNNESDPDWKESNQENSSSDWLVGLKFEKHDAGNASGSGNQDMENSDI